MENSSDVNQCLPNLPAMHCEDAENSSLQEDLKLYDITEQIEEQIREESRVAIISSLGEDMELYDAAEKFSQQIRQEISQQRGEGVKRISTEPLNTPSEKRFRAREERAGTSAAPQEETPPTSVENTDPTKIKYELAGGKMEFHEYSKKSSDKSSVWHHFLRTATGQHAKCNHCLCILKSNTSTSVLHAHLKKKHLIDLKSNENSDSTMSEQQRPPVASTSNNPPAKRTKITDYYDSKDSLQDVVTRMVVLDGLPLKTFCSSQDLQNLLQKNYKDVPKSPNTIKTMVMKMCDREKSKLRAELKDMKSQNTMWAITLDEWTSIKSHRYMNVNIHSHDDNGENVFRNLGLVRILGSMGAEACASLIEIRLDSFGISLEKDIIGLTTDGAAIMVKLGRISPALFHQLCLAHGVQLAVYDVLYKTDLAVMDRDSRPDSDTDSDDNDDGFVVEHSGSYAQLKDEYQKVIKKVRTVVKMFKNSPTKNDSTLQRYVRTEFGKELQLLLDCKTRWSSLSTMLERFLKLRSCVQKALIDVKSGITFSDIEILCLKNLQEALDMIKTTVEVLCRRDTTILSADTALKFLVKSLDGQDTISSDKLADSLKKRIKERRLYTVVGALEYLQNPNQFLKDGNGTEEDIEAFEKPSYDEIKSVILKAASASQDYSTVSRHNQSRFDDIDPLPSLTSQSQRHANTNLSFKEKLNQQLLSLECHPSTQSRNNIISGTDLPSMIDIEMVLFENGGARGDILRKAQNRLLSIPPTSVEAERAFSTAGMFCNKLRSRLNDETLDAFMFLRSRYLKKTD